jgi:hypothetical protein
VRGGRSQTNYNLASVDLSTGAVFVSGGGVKMRQYYKRLERWVEGHERLLVFTTTASIYNIISIPLTLLIGNYQMTIGVFAMSFLVGLTFLTLYDIWRGFKDGTD